MSLIPTYVYATDGLFYRNPVIKGNNYFICFDDKDPPELVMIEEKKEISKEVYKKAAQILTKERLAYIINVQHIERAKRCFGNNKLKAAVSIFFELLGPIPPPKGIIGIKNIEFECAVEGIAYNKYLELKNNG